MDGVALHWEEETEKPLVIFLFLGIFAAVVPMILAIFCTLIVVSYELHDRVKLAAEESSKNKIECMEEIYIGDML